MSEQDWRGFLAAQAVEDWVVPQGSATAVFRVGSLGEAARLAEALAKVPGLVGSGALLGRRSPGLRRITQGRKPLIRDVCYATPAAILLRIVGGYII